MSATGRIWALSFDGLLHDETIVEHTTKVIAEMHDFERIFTASSFFIVVLRYLSKSIRNIPNF
jgi:hypothetical protein